MPTEVRWLASASASCYHAVELLQRTGHLNDVKLESALRPVLRNLADFLADASLPSERFMEHAVPLSVGIHGARQLAAAILTKVAGPRRNAQWEPRLAGILQQMESQFHEVVPGLVDELALRAAPLREQWDARGPGLLTQIARLTEPILVVPAADVVLVQPLEGGGGRPHLLYNSVRIEAVLANPVAELPEVARLAWLISQLNADLPMHQGDLQRSRLNEVAALAMLPVALAAAEEVELARNDKRGLILAIESWYLPLQAASPADGSDAEASRMKGPLEIADTLASWWRTYLDGKPPWNVALAALDRMLT
jgi:hypothetical protein